MSRLWKRMAWQHRTDNKALHETMMGKFTEHSRRLTEEYYIIIGLISDYQQPCYTTNMIVHVTSQYWFCMYILMQYDRDEYFSIHFLKWVKEKIKRCGTVSHDMYSPGVACHWQASKQLNEYRHLAEKLPFMSTLANGIAFGIHFLRLIFSHNMYYVQSDLVALYLCSKQI